MHRLLLLFSLIFNVGCIDSVLIKPADTILSMSLPPLPLAISNNAVAKITTSRGDYLASFSGLLAGKQWNDTSAKAFLLAPEGKQWLALPDVPGGHGRLASIAASAGPYAYIFGGYTVAADHSEVSLPLVHRFDPIKQQYKRMADMPVPVDDAMALVYQERYIYLISGWHDTANVNLVQRYDTHENSWVQATAYPGPPLFGHSGGMVGNQLLVCGGVKILTGAIEPRVFAMNNLCFAGTIRIDNARRIDWRSVDPMPGAARYRSASAGVRSSNSVLFVGGSDNPYNYDGVGYDGMPSEPVSSVWQFSFETNSWNRAGELKAPTMDHRGLLFKDGHFITAGGMVSGRNVSAAVTALLVRTSSASESSP